MKKDKIFLRKDSGSRPFSFNKEVAQVFDDMARRSIPGYPVIQKLLVQALKEMHPPCKTLTVYDLGCSTGTTFKSLSKAFKGKKLHYIGVDNSSEMLKRFHQKIRPFPEHTLELVCENIEKLSFTPCHSVILLFTLQFIPLQKRAKILKRIVKALPKGGVLFLGEKVKSPWDDMQDLQNDLYWRFKQDNGYHQREILRKDQALKNVLIPLTLEKNIDMLKKAGLKKQEILYKHYTFSFIMATK